MTPRQKLLSAVDAFVTATDAYDSTDADDKESILELEAESLRFAAAKIREAGEAGTERMADFVESLIVNLRG